jgi:small subunit ribosomal protein S3
MGQKTHPIGLRLGIVKDWDSRWFAQRNYAELLKEDLLIKRYLKKRLYQAGISKITIERKGQKVTIGIRTARPGLVIGRKGEQVDKLSEEMKTLTGKVVQLNIEEIKRAGPRCPARRGAHREAARAARVVPPRDEEGDRFVDARGALRASASRRRAVSGGAEMARYETYREGPCAACTRSARTSTSRAPRDDAVRHVRREGVDVPR